MTMAVQGWQAWPPRQPLRLLLPQSVLELELQSLLDLQLELEL
jgi:hypothetical protein